MRWQRFFVAISCLIAAVAMVSRPVMAQHSISCSSNDGKRHTCTVDTRGGVSMTRQRSDAGCEEGFSWGYDRTGVWVDHGCRADFTVNSGYGGEPAESGGGRLTLTCSSDDGKRHYCPADTRGGVRMFNQRSKAHCTQGSSWGYDSSGVWVDRGCRADFRLR